LFWINVAIGLALMGITILMAPILAWFYRDTRLTGITLAFSVTFLICALRVQHEALLKRQMRFFSFAIRDVSSSVVGVAVGITLAWRGAGYWALVALPITMNLVQMLMSWSMAGWIPGRPRRDAKVRSLIGFGGNVAASYLVLNVIGNADNVLVGWYWGAGPLGLYSRAYNLLMVPLRQLGSPTGRVAVPAFSRIQADAERLARYYLRTANLMMWMLSPAISFLFVAAAPVIVLVLGNRWREAAPVFQLLAIYALGQQLFNSIVWLTVARGQSQRLLKLSLLISVVVVGSYAIGLPFGIKGVALSGSLMQLAILPWVMKFSFCGTNLTLKRLGEAIKWPVSVCLASVCFAETALRLIAPQRVWSQLLVTALSCAVVYSFSLLIPPVRREVAFLRSLLAKSLSDSSADLAESLT
jgi:PST family polysaccharide transporter